MAFKLPSTQTPASIRGSEHNFILNPDAENGTTNVTLVSAPTFTADTSADRIAGAASFKLVLSSTAQTASWVLDTIPAYWNNTQLITQTDLNVTALTGVLRVGLYDTTGSVWVNDAFMDISSVGKYRLQKLATISTSNTYVLRAQLQSGSACTVLFDNLYVGPNDGVIGQSIAEKVRVKYSSDSGQSIPTGSATIVNFEDKEEDEPGTDSVTTGATWKFTAPRAGTYRVSTSLLFTTTTRTAGSEYTLALYKNGSIFKNLYWEEVEVTGASYLTVAGDADIILAAGEYINVQVAHNEPASKLLYTGGVYNWIAITELTDYHETRYGTNSDVVYVSNSSTSDANDTTSFAYGPAGSSFPGALSNTRYKLVNLPNGFTTDDDITLQVQDNSLPNAWQPVDENVFGSLGYFYQNTTNYGMFWQPQAGSTTQIRVYFSPYSRTTGATFGAAGESWASISGKWRLRVSKNPLGIGVPIANSSRGGTVGNLNGMGLTGALSNTAKANGPIGEVVHSSIPSTIGVLNATWTNPGGVSIILNRGIWELWAVVQYSDAGAITGGMGYNNLVIARDTVGTTPWSSGLSLNRSYWDDDSSNVVRNVATSPAIWRSDGTNIVDMAGNSYATQTLYLDVYQTNLSGATLDMVYGHLIAKRIG